MLDFLSDVAVNLFNTFSHYPFIKCKNLCDRAFALDEGDRVLITAQGRLKSKSPTAMRSALDVSVAGPRR